MFPELPIRSAMRATESGKTVYTSPVLCRGSFFAEYSKKSLTKPFVCDKILLPLVNRL